MDINNLGQADDVFRVLRIFADTDSRSELHWIFDTDGEIRLFAMCSDTFAWASADLEEITSDDVALLEQTAKDVLAIDYAATIYFPELYACRKRKMRPMKAFYDTLERNCGSRTAAKLTELFDACGPERTE